MELNKPVEPAGPRWWSSSVLHDSLAKLEVWASLPSLAGEEESGASRTLFFLSLGLMAMAAFSLVQAWVHGWIGAACTCSAEELCLVFAFWLNRRGKMEWATRIICCSELAFGLFLISFFGAGFSDEELLLFPLILVTAAVLLDWRSYISFAGLVVASVALTGFYLAATGGVGTTYNRVANVINILLITVVAVGLLSGNLKRSVSQSREAERRITALSGRLMSAQEEERARIARDLHDDLSQQLAAVSIGMGSLKRSIPEEQSDSRAQSDRLHQQLVRCAETVRRISHELHPAILRHSGLAAALRAHCTEFGASTGVQVSFTVEGELATVPSDSCLCIYRISQEALWNIAKHAKVTAAAVEIRHSEGLLTLTVSDRGVGMNPACAAATGGLGLVSIRERARLAGGSVEMITRPNQGLTIRVRIPDQQRGPSLTSASPLKTL